ncbi:MULTISPECIES: hypothetical protein [Stenotrophomonas]|uniref:hypothetical protein n=1 Tax=Stenotrophomonas maltophilia group TaxID=995085 RepID=UPI00040B6728|nr:MULTISPECIES: hypothetical protein [Stenotrophomonas]KDE89419.1 hypothetical protein DF40_015360 [Stenotrophomonas maltophilia M30]KOO71385.1 hypothetical protein VK66_01310 [Stenotrophomonas maltophilia]KOO78214.1 hypothetical protein VO93_06315 [Stenotrophomonas maltophilia]MBA0351730.1 hypothetical protein [Stenotrophomonas maltophilia]MBA0455282.1 hypothetical protein [Stenotrophomonas maltophilia]
MQPLILSLDPSLSTHFSTLTPQALAQLAADTSTSVIVPNLDMRGLHPGQVLTLQLATLDSFLDVADAANG